MQILANPKKLIIVVQDDTGRIIYRNYCINQVHFEVVKYMLKKVKEGKSINPKFLDTVPDNINKKTESASI
jgi:hypothetical protein